MRLWLELRPRRGSIDFHRSPIPSTLLRVIQCCFRSFCLWTRPPFASLFTTWLEFSIELDDKIFCLHFEMTSDAFSAVMESGFVFLSLRKFTKPLDSLDWKSWFCRFQWQRVCHARAVLEVSFWRQASWWISWTEQKSRCPEKKSGKIWSFTKPPGTPAP